MRGLARIVLGALLTAALAYACYELWMWAEAEIKGTPFAAFKFFGSVLAVFVGLSFAELVFGGIERVIARRSTAPDS